MVDSEELVGNRGYSSMTLWDISMGYLYRVVEQTSVKYKVFKAASNIKAGNTTFVANLFCQNFTNVLLFYKKL